MRAVSDPEPERLDEKPDEKKAQCTLSGGHEDDIHGQRRRSM